MLQLIILHDFLWIEFDFPKQLMQAVDIFKFFFGLVHDPDVEVCWLVDDFFDVEDEVSHSLGSSHFLIKITLQMVDARYFVIK